MTAFSSTRILVESCDRPGWERLLGDVQGDGVTPFHTWNWCAAQGDLPGMTFEPILCTDEAAEARWLVPVFIQDGTAAASVFGYGGPIALDSAPIAFDVLDNVVREATGLSLARVSLAPGAQSVAADMASAGWAERRTYIADLGDDFEQLWSRVDGAARTGARYGASRGIIVEPLRIADWELFSRWQQDLLEQKGATYEMPLEFLMGLRTRMPSTALVVLGAYRDDDLLGASAFLYGARAMYYWLHVASPEGRSFQVQDLMLATAFREACAHGLGAADLGAASTSAHVAPKLRWGARPVTVFAYDRSTRC